MSKYFILSSGEDGTSISGPMPEEALLKYLQADLEDDEPHTILTKVPDSDKGCWMDVPEDAILIIKGDIVVPKKKQVVTKYTLDDE